MIKFDPDEKSFTCYPLPRQTDNPNIDRTPEGAIVYTTRSNLQAALAIFYPDVSRMTTYGAFREDWPQPPLCCPGTAGFQLKNCRRTRRVFMRPAF
jgi:hypothetical protein